MIRRRRGGEEGQVTPALLTAVIGGFALAVAFVSLQDVLDQSGRAATASDAAALAVGQEHEDALLGIFEGSVGNHLGQLAGLLSGTPTPRANAVAQQYAAANGADVVDVDFDGFDLGQRRWEYTVTTRQKDTVEGGGTTARSESTSRVAVEITRGFCSPGGGVGLIVDGTCAALLDLVTLCDLELNPPPPPPPPPEEPGPGGPGDGPEEPAEPEEPAYTPPPGLEGVGCVNPLDILDMDVKLIN